MTYLLCVRSISGSAMNVQLRELWAVKQRRQQVLIDVPDDLHDSFIIGEADPALFQDLLTQTVWRKQGSALVADTVQFRSEIVKPLVHSVRQRLPGTDLKTTSIFLRTYTPYKGKATGLTLHADRMQYTYRVTWKAMDTAQMVLFINNDNPALQFILHHLPGIWYAGHESVMSDRLNNKWKHMVVDMDQAAESVLSVVIDYGPGRDVFDGTRLFLEDFSEDELPDEDDLTIHDATCMGQHFQMRVMANDDSSVLNQCRVDSGLARSEFCGCMNSIDYLAWQRHSVVLLDDYAGA